MEQRLDCDIVRDLLPSYLENMTSQVSNQYIDEHLKSCEECRNICKQMGEEIKIEVVPEVKNFKKYLNNVKVKYSMIGLFIIGIIAIITCVIVNLAVEKRLSWSLIVIGGIVYTYLPLYIYMKTQTNRWIKMLLGISLYLIPFLGLIQVVLYYIMEKGDIWIWNIAIPIALLWLAVIWIGILFNKLMKFNICSCISVIIFLSIPANFFTDIIANGSKEWSDVIVQSIINSSVNLIVGIIFLVIGIRGFMKKKSKL